MILEVAFLIVQSGQEKKFENAFNEAQGIIMTMPGYISHSLKRSADTTNKYMLQVTWEKMEDHTQGFRKSSAYQQWKKLLHPFYNPVPRVEYFMEENLFSGSN